jgi:DNA polymerase III delta prime subunit
MNALSYQPEITEKLNFFLTSGKIPNIIFHGANGSGKRTIVRNFIADIYKHNKELIKNYVMYVNCAHGKGIKFVREELKFFAKTHINIEGVGNFKTIVLSNADELTIDAQSALRRCIEVFSHTTRFFIIVQDKYKLLKPILSRLCELFVCEPVINEKKTNLHKHNINLTFGVSETIEKKMYKSIDKLVQPLLMIHDVVDADTTDDTTESIPNYQTLMELAKVLYENGYSGLDLMKYIEQLKTLNDMKKYQMLIVFNNVKKEFRNEKLFILFILNFLLLRSDYDLENISFM